MSEDSATKECPHCLSPMEILPDDEGRRCPVCQYSVRPCPACSGEMVKRVEAPEGLGIEEGGLPIEQCTVYWICRSQRCGHKIETSL